MKKNCLFLLFLGAMVLILGVLSDAMALTIDYNEPYSPGTNYLMDASATGEHQIHMWIFDITDNTGWSTPGQVFGNGTITLELDDDEAGENATEKATFTFDGGIGLTNTKIENPGWSGNFTVESTQFSDGLIHATLEATVGDFIFRSAILTVTSSYEEQSGGGDDPPPVPEPGTMLLLGTGLLGFGFAIKRFNRT